MNQSAPELIQLLKLASCLGSDFSAGVLFLVWRKSPEVKESGSFAGDDPSADFRELLEDAIQGNFIERCNDTLRWVHDKVQGT